MADSDDLAAFPGRRAMLRRLAAWLLVFTVTYQSTSPALHLVLAAQATLDPNAAQALCLASGWDHLDPLTPGKAPASGTECCLVCQASPLAAGAPAPPTLHKPTESASLPGMSAATQAAAAARPAFLLLPARAPPQA
ncbi:MAG: hypothetical protein HY985_15565 [Magnetospirillum sp.]|nr:hypothetical protein [Magnetospirillum sp.]